MSTLKTAFLAAALAGGAISSHAFVPIADDMTISRIELLQALQENQDRIFEEQPIQRQFFLSKVKVNEVIEYDCMITKVDNQRICKAEFSTTNERNETINRKIDIILLQQNPQNGKWYIPAVSRYDENKEE